MLFRFAFVVVLMFSFAAVSSQDDLFYQDLVEALTPIIDRYDSRAHLKPRLPGFILLLTMRGTALIPEMRRDIFTGLDICAGEFSKIALNVLQEQDMMLFDIGNSIVANSTLRYY